MVYGPFSIVWGLGCAFLTAFLYKYKDKRDSTIFLAGTVLGGAYEYICSVFTELVFGTVFCIFLAGTVLGGAYEYICSVFTELVFGTVFWDYSKIPFNLGGRINLLFCFFWGIAAVVWLKVLYPFFSKWIEKLPKKVGKPMIWIAVVLMTVNIGIFFWGIAAVVWLKVLYPFFSKWIEKLPKKVGKPMIWIAVVLMTVNIGISALALYRYSDRQVNPKAENVLEEFLDTHFDDTRMDHIYPNAKIRK